MAVPSGRVFYTDRCPLGCLFLAPGSGHRNPSTGISWGTAVAAVVGVFIERGFQNERDPPRDCVARSRLTACPRRRGDRIEILFAAVHESATETSRDGSSSSAGDG